MSIYLSIPLYLLIGYGIALVDSWIDPDPWATNEDMSAGVCMVLWPILVVVQIFKAACVLPVKIARRRREQLRAQEIELTTLEDEIDKLLYSDDEKSAVAKN